MKYESLKPQVESRWRKVASLGQGRREDLSHACVVYNGSILLMGGQGEGEQVIQDDFLTGTPLKSCKYKKVNLG